MHDNTLDSWGFQQRLERGGFSCQAHIVCETSGHNSHASVLGYALAKQAQAPQKLHDLALLFTVPIYIMCTLDLT